MANADTVAEVGKKFQTLGSLMDERIRRLWAACEAAALGRGGVTAVAEATGMSRTTIRAGIVEGPGAPRPRVRRAVVQFAFPLRSLRLCAALRDGGCFASGLFAQLARVRVTSNRMSYQSMKASGFRNPPTKVRDDLTRTTASAKVSGREFATATGWG